MPIIGYIGANTETINRPERTVFMHRLTELGWVEGRSVAIEYRAAEGLVERAGEIAAEFAQLKVDIIVTTGGAQVLAAKRAAPAIPVVFVAAGDPVGNGLAASLARPGGIITGLSTANTDTAGKRLEFLREIVPGLRRLAILGNFSNRAVGLELAIVQAEARGYGVETIPLSFQRIEEIEPAIQSLGGRAEALYVCIDPLVIAHWACINALALAARLPAVHGFRAGVAADGLLSYGPDRVDLFRRAAELASKILRGTKPADLPVEQPTKFELIVNTRTAKALGLTIPPSILARADEVIE